MHLLQELVRDPFQDLFERQRRHFRSGATRAYEWRMDQLDRMARLLSENEETLHVAIRTDFKTASQEYLFETYACLGEIMYQQSQLKDWMTPVEAPVPKALAVTGHKAYIHREPHGVALIIGPFNGPLLLVLRPAIAALAAGNSCILKLSPALPATSALMARLVDQYFEPCSVAAIVGGREETLELLRLPFHFIFFTGSTAVGKVVARAAAEHLTPVILQLGGQNPVVVDETADIADAARKIVWGAMSWGGQWCSSPGYVCVHESVAEEFVAKSVAALVDLYGEDPKANPDYSRLISAGEVHRLAALLDMERVVIGGEIDPVERYFAPTILYPAQWSDPIMQEEVFGPVLPILIYKTFDEVLERISAKPSPLAAYIFTRNQRAIDRFWSELSFGGGPVNQVNIHLFIESMPFGGIGASGMGQYYGKHGFDALTHPKSMLVSPPGVAIEHLLPPYTAAKNNELTMWFDY
ncbi:aldehyde dehydrogenase family protein [Silvibacterium sp.]|uniref:aldehyde dehydrogenase family protein n=1 Tax=Silvibacterium sp. TaxID=1964179 RepID=UPI0039E34C25